MENKFNNIPKEKFAFANSEGRLHDKELVTKPVSYLKDAWYRFRRNKASIVGAIVIGILILYAIIAPMISPYTVAYEDTTYQYTAPKIFENTGFLDGTRKKTVNRETFSYNYAIGVETGHNAIQNQKFTKETKEDKNGKLVDFYTFRIDTYHEGGVVFKEVTPEEYFSIQKYQDEHNVQIIYPITRKNARPKAPQDETNANYWYETSFKGGKTVVKGESNEDGTYEYKNIYKHYSGIDMVESTQGVDENGNVITIPNPGYNKPYDGYTSKMLIENRDVPEGQTAERLYDYAYHNQTGYQIRVDYYEYYRYYHSEVKGDKITEPWFIFGTTNSGKDIFTCLASGARFSFLLAITVASVNLIVGAIYGAIEGYYGGKIDIVMERLVEILSAVPFMIIVTLLKYHMADSSQVLILFISFFLTGWIGMAGQTRMQFYRFKNQEYVLAARTLGAKDPRIMFKHIFPNSLGTLITGSVLVIPGMIFSETSLSYLGIINLSTGSMTSVGTLLAAGQPYLVTYPHMILFPSIFVCLLMLSFNLFGNGLRDAFNPSLRGSED